LAGKNIEVLPMSDVIRLASHSHHYPVVFDKHTGEPLYLGRARRTASPGQRIVLHAKPLQVPSTTSVSYAVDWTLQYVASGQTAFARERRPDWCYGCWPGGTFPAGFFTTVSVVAFKGWNRLVVVVVSVVQLLCGVSSTTTTSTRVQVNEESSREQLKSACALEANATLAPKATVLATAIPPRVAATFRNFRMFPPRECQTPPSRTFVTQCWVRSASCRGRLGTVRDVVLGVGPATPPGLCVVSRRAAAVNGIEASVPPCKDLKFFILDVPATSKDCTGL
jgi:Domain of unknown function (DUF222)